MLVKKNISQARVKSSDSARNNINPNNKKPEIQIKTPEK